ncbi:transposase [Puniceibacterium sp. IMCC21224]
MGTTSVYNWRAKFGGMGASIINRMKSQEDENCWLRRMFA